MSKPRIFIVGSGAREHAIGWKLTQEGAEIISSPGNAGLASLGRCYGIAAEDIEGMTKLSKDLAPDLVVIGPEGPLDTGLADSLRANGLLVFGPSAAATLVTESSKLLAKQVMQAAGVPTADYRAYRPWEFEEALAQLRTSVFPIVIKEDGLAAGKGVKIARSRKAAEAFVKSLANAEKTFLLEDYLEGVECSVMAITDGTHIVTFPAIQDYKLSGVGDTGENTGGMGAVTPIAACDLHMLERVENEILLPMLKELQKRGTPFVGCLYGGLMITKTGPVVMEFNARFGDPETEIAMLMLDESLLQLLLSAARGKLSGSRRARMHSGACACVVLASGGYPGNYEKGKLISGVLESSSWEDTAVFHANTELRKNGVYSIGGRVLVVTARRRKLEEALRSIYSIAGLIQFDKAYLRPDIGSNANKLP